MDCTFTGRTLILSKATKPSRDDSEQLREVIKISGHIELEAFAVMMGCAQTEIANWWHHDDDLRCAQWVIAHGSTKRGEGDE